MTTIEPEYNELTTAFYSKDNLFERKINGIYMTPYTIINKCFENEKIENYKEILEPSFGSGQFLDILIKLKSNSNKINITGIELNKELHKLVKQKYKDYNLLCENFLNYETDKQYDLIVGNPPYFEFLLDKIRKEQYKEIICGRVNIYTLFIYKSIQLLKPNGKIIFVIPTSLLSSKYFEKLRFYIYKHCNIECIEILKNNDFKDALQSTMIFKISKLSNTNIPNDNFIVKFTDTIIFSNTYTDINNILKNKKFIKDYDCDVKTGNIIWNNVKENLSNTKFNDEYILLIYPRNLKNNNIILENHSIKKQYIKINKEPIKAPFIAINRIIGMTDISLKPVFVKTSTDKYFFENHINVITGNIENLEIIYNSLIKTDTIHFIKNIIGNTQLSKNELLTMIPIF